MDAEAGHSDGSPDEDEDEDDNDDDFVEFVDPSEQGNESSLHANKDFLAAVEQLKSFFTVEVLKKSKKRRRAVEMAGENGSQMNNMITPVTFESNVNTPKFKDYLTSLYQQLWSALDNDVLEDQLATQKTIFNVKWDIFFQVSNKNSTYMALAEVTEEYPRIAFEILNNAVGEKLASDHKFYEKRTVCVALVKATRSLDSLSVKDFDKYVTVSGEVRDCRTTFALNSKTCDTETCFSMKSIGGEHSDEAVQLEASLHGQGCSSSIVIGAAVEVTGIYSARPNGPGCAGLPSLKSFFEVSWVSDAQELSPTADDLVTWQTNIDTKPNFLQKLASSAFDTRIIPIHTAIVLLLAALGSGSTEGEAKLRSTTHVVLIDATPLQVNHIFNSLSELSKPFVEITAGTVSKAGLNGTLSQGVNKEPSWLPGAAMLASKGILAVRNLHNLPDDVSHSLSDILESGYYRVNMHSIQSLFTANVTLIASVTWDGYERAAKFLRSRMDIAVKLSSSTPEYKTGVFQLIRQEYDPHEASKIPEMSPEEVKRFFAHAKSKQIRKMDREHILHHVPAFYVKALEVFGSDFVDPRLVNRVLRLACTIARIHLRDTVTKVEVGESINIVLDCLFAQDKSKKYAHESEFNRFIYDIGNTCELIRFTLNAMFRESSMQVDLNDLIAKCHDDLGIMEATVRWAVDRKDFESQKKKLLKNST